MLKQTVLSKLILLLVGVLALGLSGNASGALPPGWTSQDIGTTGGSASESGGVWTIAADGTDIWGASDQMHFVWIPVSGNAVVTCRVTDVGTGTNNWAKGGVMIRETLNANSKNACVMITPSSGGGLTFQVRENTGGSSTSQHTQAPNVTRPHWVRIVREGDVFTGWRSLDGITWTQQGALRTVVMSKDVYMGIAVTSHASAEIRTYTIDNVTAEPMRRASQPSPVDGAILTATHANLGWVNGATVNTHELYFGEDQAAVAAGTGGTFVRSQPASTNFLFVGLGFEGDPRPGGLVLGTTYYWRVDEVEADGLTRHPGLVYSFFVPPLKAYDPSPTSGSAVVATDTDLTWRKGMSAMLHTVYFGTDPDIVANAIAGGIPAAVTTFAPPALDPETTYYWRVDELDTGGGTHKGDLWSFTTAPEGLGQIVMQRWEGISGTALSALTGNANYPNNPTVTENLTSFIWDVTDLNTYGARIFGWVYAPATGDYTFRLATDDNGQLWLSTDDDPENLVQIASVSGYSGVNEFGKFAAQTSAPVHLVAGEKYYIQALWKEGSGGDHCHVQWSGPVIGDFATIAGKYLSPFAPLAAYGPNPSRNATDISQTPTMTWIPGIKAVTHQIYLGTDPDAVANATPASPLYKGSKPLGSELYEPGELLWDTTYYWRIDEVNTLEIDSPWKGKVWSFTTRDYFVLDDFEDYNNFTPDRVFETWADGWGTTNNGSIVGHPDPDFVANETFIETGTIHGGRQSMPFYFDNNMKYSEATRTLAGPYRNWTQHDLKSLSLWYYGYPDVLGDFVEGPAGTYTLTATGRDIWNIGGSGENDEFHFAWKRLNGPGSITARIVSMTQPNTWTKGGLMIRETLDPNSANLFNLVAYNSMRVRMQSRPGTAQTTASAGEITALATLTPRWLKLDRDFSGNFTASHANDVGGNPDVWTQFASANVQMAANVYIGLALTSHQYNTPAVAVFDRVTTTGNITGATWTHHDIGIRSNAAEPMYVSIRDGSGRTATVYNTNPDASRVTGWTQWGEYGQGIALSEFTTKTPGLNLANVDSISLGFGTKGSAQPGGSGLMFFDDIRLNPARCVWQVAKPAGDFNNNCVVDMPDLEIMTDNWLEQPVDMTETVWSGVWSNSDIGTVYPAGNFTIDGAGTFTIEADGADIWGTADAFHFASQSLSGDGQITVRINSVENTNGWAKAGVMIRDTIDPNSAHAMMVITPANGAAMQYRAAAGGSSSNLQTSGLQAPICLKLVRTGNTLSGYYSSPDGWVLQGSVDIAMTDPVRIGIALTSHSSGALCTATGDRTCSALVLTTDMNQDGVTDFQDYAVLTDSWLEEQLWP